VAVGIIPVVEVRHLHIIEEDHTAPISGGKVILLEET
jgi:hypothetical protein